MRRSLTVLFFLLFGIVLFLAYHFSSNAPVTAEKVYQLDEEAQTASAVAHLLKSYNATKPLMLHAVPIPKDMPALKPILQLPHH